MIKASNETYSDKCDPKSKDDLTNSGDPYNNGLV